MAIPAAPQTSAAYRSALLALQRQQRARLTTLIQQTEAALHEDWTRGPGIVAQYYAPLIDQYARALNDLRALNDDPAARLPLDWLRGQNNALTAIETNVKYTLDKYANQSVDAVTAAQQAAANAGLSDASALTQEALSPAWEKGVDPSVLFNRPNPDAIAQWVGRAGNGHPLGDLFDNFGVEATSAARQAMLLGLATGANPLQMVRGIQDAMGISRSRAIAIARTSVLGSYRAAAHETYRANSDVLQGWVWSAGGANPCACCAGMDGTLHSLDESMDDHPLGKCTPIPATKSWADILGPLGIDTSDMAETSIAAPGNYTPISERFSSYSPERQRAIIGTKTGYEAYQRGEVSLKDFVGVRPPSDGFPSSYYQKSLRELQIPTRQAARLVEPSPALAEKLALGKLRASDLGKVTPDELMPAWAKQSEASRIVYQILRNGLPYDMTGHEYGLLITNLEQMLREDLPVNVRAAAERQLQALGQQVERQTVGAAAQETEQQVGMVVERNVNLIPDPTFNPRYEYDPEKNLAEISQRLFGRELSPSEVGSLVGAPDGSNVTYRASGDAIHINLYGPSWNPEAPYDLSKAEYSAERILYRDDSGRLVMGNMTNLVRDDLQGQGLGADIFVDQVQSLARLGVDEVHTFAAGGGIGTTGFQEGAAVGYYVWPRFGYIGKLPLESRQALRAAADAGTIPQEWSTFKTIQQLMRTQAGRDWWKMNGDSLDLAFNLKPNSLSMRLLKQYLAEKGRV